MATDPGPRSRVRAIGWGKDGIAVASVAILVNGEIRELMKKIASIAVAALLLAGTAGVAHASPPQLGAATTSVSQAVKAKKYPNCKALNRVYKGGVAKTKTAKNTKTVHGKKVRAASSYRPKVSATLYNLNKGLDRDKDKIACER